MTCRVFSKHDVVCSADGCDIRIGRGKLFCEGHYFSIPKPMRTALWDAWRAAMDARRDMKPRTEQNQLNAAYQAIFQQCREHLRATRPTPADAMATVAYDARDFAARQVSGGAPKEFRFVNGRML